SLTASAKACACQGSANTGPPSSRGRRGSAATRLVSWMESGWFKIVLPQVEVTRIARRGLLTPQFARRKAYRAEMLRLGAKMIGTGVRVLETANAVVGCDNALSSSRVARQPRV